MLLSLPNINLYFFLDFFFPLLEILDLEVELLVERLDLVGIFLLFLDLDLVEAEKESLDLFRGVSCSFRDLVRMGLYMEQEVFLGVDSLDRYEQASKFVLHFLVSLVTSREIKSNMTQRITASQFQALNKKIIQKKFQETSRFCTFPIQQSLQKNELKMASINE